jgi:AmiR/NasT family two-component response regulator
MADVSTITILQERLGKEQDLLNEQLQTALTSRVVIEQAKGVLATRLDIEMDDAFDRMRKHSRDERRRLVEVAEEVVNARSGDLPAAFRDHA